MKNLKYLLIAFVFISFSTVYASPTSPVTYPPGGNPPAPLNVGDSTQTVNGKIGVDSFCLPGSKKDYKDCTSGTWQKFISSQGGVIAGNKKLSWLTKWSASTTDLIKKIEASSFYEANQNLCVGEFGTQNQVCLGNTDVSDSTNGINSTEGTIVKCSV